MITPFKGNIGKFNSMEPQWKGEPDLVAAYPALRQKITLLTIMEIVFQCTSRDRGIAFADIAATAQLPLDHVSIEDITFDSN